MRPAFILHHGIPALDVIDQIVRAIGYRLPSRGGEARVQCLHQSVRTYRPIGNAGMQLQFSTSNAASLVCRCAHSECYLCNREAVQLTTAGCNIRRSRCLPWIQESMTAECIDLNGTRVGTSIATPV